MVKNKKIPMLLSLTGIFLILLGSLITYGKYISNSVWEYYLESKGFYFSSNELWEDGKTNTILNWALDPVEFRVSNSKHNTLFTEYDIEYEIECTILNDASEHTSCYLNNKESNTDTVILKKTFECINETEDEVDVSSFDPKQCEKEDYTLKYEKTEKVNFFEIVSNNINYNIKDIEVQIKVKSTKPYKKELVGNFILKKDELIDNKVVHNYKEYNNYSEVILTNSFAEDKCVLLNFNDEDFSLLGFVDDYTLIPNNDGNIDKLKFLVNKKNNKVIKFLRLKNENYTKDNFTFSLENDCSLY